MDQGKALILATAAMAFVACAPTRWERTGPTAADPALQRDEYECRREALMVPPAPTPLPGSGFVAGYTRGLAIRRQVEARKLYEDCMATRGYRKVP
ncbi:MAG: hypothetical protein HY002_03640 [Candidatus Rokubacteria bacterium]|nr:hypothetical protein [Candidatus Rokubacteria bacterium]